MGSMWPQLQSPCGYGDPMNLDVEVEIAVVDPFLKPCVIPMGFDTLTCLILCLWFSMALEKGETPLTPNFINEQKGTV